MPNLCENSTFFRNIEIEGANNAQKKGGTGCTISITQTKKRTGRSTDAYVQFAFFQVFGG